MAAQFAEGVDLAATFGALVMADGSMAGTANGTTGNVNGAYALTLTDIITALAESGRKAKAQLRIDVIPV